MSLAIILVYNLIVGFLICKMSNNCKSSDIAPQNRLWVKTLKIVLVLPGVFCYILQIISVVEGMYKMAITLDFIIISSLFALVYLKPK